MRDFLPEHVYESIRQHLVQQGNAATVGWEAGSAEEDTLTGHLGATLQTNVWVREDGEWRWRVRYKKFRGRGPGAFERISGADGIIQIEVGHQSESEQIVKGVVFQAKKGDIRRSKKLLDQVDRMESLAPDGSVILSYAPEQYRALKGRAYLQEHPELLVPRDKPEHLGDYLGEKFLGCSSGRLGMYFDAVRQLLVIPQADGSSKVIQVEMGSRLSIEVEGP